MQITKMRLPTCQEWCYLVNVVDGDDFIMHWKRMYSWCQDTDSTQTGMCCGCHTSNLRLAISDTSRSSKIGFRPVFEVKDPGDLGPDGTTVVVGTLYMNGQPMKVPTRPFPERDIPDYHVGARLELRPALADAAYQVQAIRIGDVLIADRVLVKNITRVEIERQPMEPEDAHTQELRRQFFLDSLLFENAANLADPNNKYAQGYHDALLDVMKGLTRLANRSRSNQG